MKTAQSQTIEQNQMQEATKIASNINVISRTSGDDILVGIPQIDVMDGNTGNDFLNGDNSNDILFGARAQATLVSTRSGLSSIIVRSIARIILTLQMLLLTRYESIRLRQRMVLLYLMLISWQLRNTQIMTTKTL